MIDNEKTTILVPWDFTERAENALQHAIKIAKHLNNDITLLHILKKQKDEEEALPKMQSTAEETYQKYQIKPAVVAQEGSIFDTIGEYTQSKPINLVVMGTHGIKGMQKLTGSWALKVIVSCHAPFIVVQDPPSEKTGFENIVFPIDFKSENKEKLIWAIYLGRIFKSKIHLFKQEYTDSSLIKKINSNLIFAKKYLQKYNIEFEIHTAAGKGSFAEETIDCAQQISADMMLIMTTKNIGFSDYVIGAHEQYIIANTAKIPVMCVNPRKATNFSLETF